MRERERESFEERISGRKTIERGSVKIIISQGLGFL